jgi:phosphoserine phosphatase RsbU/P
VTDKALLLVDDESSIRVALQRELRDWAAARGLRILTADSVDAAEKVMAAEAGAVCLVLSDVRMPGKSGLDLVHFLHGAYPDTIALLLTGFAELPEIIKAVEEGAFSFLLKPWDPAYLKAELEKAWAVYTLREQARVHTRHLEEDLRWAGELQQALFGGPMADVGGIRFSSTYRPQPELKCSGDYIDVFAYDGGRCTILVGDVAGHGVRAALVATFLKALVGAAFVDPPVTKGIVRLDSVFARLNDRICGSLPASLGMMVTLAACTIDPSRAELTVASAGHPPALLRRGGRARPIVAEGVVLGAQVGAQYPLRSVRLVDGDLLVLYTDGLTERAGETVGEGEQRLIAAVESETVDAGLAGRLAERLCPSGGFADDVAVLTASIGLPAGSGPAVDLQQV